MAANEKAREATSAAAGASAQLGHVVAIGASAGALEALRTVLGGLEASSSATFVVAVHRSPRAKDGEIAVVRLDDEVTVKRWRLRGRPGAPRVVLEPANAAMRPIVVDPRRTQVAVEGVVVGLLRL